MKKIHFNTLAPLMLAATSLNLLVGCTAYDENFDCPAGKGIGCQSVTEVKKKLNQGAIDMPETTTEAAARLLWHLLYQQVMAWQAINTRMTRLFLSIHTG